MLFELVNKFSCSLYYTGLTNSVALPKGWFSEKILNTLIYMYVYADQVEHVGIYVCKKMYMYIQESKVYTCQSFN